MGAALPPLVMRQQPAQDIPIDTGNRYGALLTAMFAFNRSFRSSTKRSGNPVITAGPTIQAGPHGFYAAGNGSGKIVTDFLPADIGFAGATARSFVIEFEQGDTSNSTVALSLGDASGTNLSQFTLKIAQSYRTVRLDTYGTDLSFSPWSGDYTRARVFLMVAYDGNVTVNFYSYADVWSTQTGAYLGRTFATQTSSLPSPLITGNTVPLNLMGGGTYGFASMDTSLSYLAMFGGSCLTLTDFYSLFQNRWQVFQKPRMPAMARALALMPAGTAMNNLTGAAQATATGSGALTTGIRLAGGAQAVASAFGSLTTGVPLAGAAQAGAVGAGALTTRITLAGGASAQAAGAGALTTAMPLAGGGQASATGAGALATGLALAGSAQAAASGTGTLNTGAAGLSGAAQAVASGNGVLTTAITLAGTAQAVASGQGGLTAAAATLSGGASASASGTGALVTSIVLAGGAAARAAGSGALATGLALAGAAAARATGAGTLTTGIALAGGAAAVASAYGALSSAGQKPAIDVSQISPAHIAVFDGSGSRIAVFGGTGARTTINGMTMKLPTVVNGKMTTDRDPDEISWYGADITQELAERATTPADVSKLILVLTGVVLLEGPFIQATGGRTYVVARLGPPDNLTVPTDWGWIARVPCVNGERFDKSTFFNRVDT